MPARIGRALPVPHPGNIARDPTMPNDDLFWLEPGALAGRAGPNRKPWDLEALRRAGITTVLSVNDGESCRPGDFTAAGLGYRCIPFSRHAPPAPGDLEHCVAALGRAYDHVSACIDARERVLVHCSSGKDRTGLFFAYWLGRRHGLAPEAAIARVRAVRPIAFSAAGWDGFAHEVLREAGLLGNATH